MPLVASLWWMWLILIGIGAVALFAGMVVGSAYAQWPGTGPGWLIACPVIVGLCLGIVGVIGTGLIVLRGILHWIAA